MRLVICDHHVVFAESFAYVLASRGATVVAVTRRLDDALGVLSREPVDLCVLDVTFGADSAVDRLGELRTVAPTTQVVLLSGQVDRELLAAGRAAKVRGIADKRRRVVEIIDLLDRVHGGERVVLADDPVDEAVSGPRPRFANDAQRLASFLTPREREVLSALVCGVDTNRMARSLGIAAATARCHIQSVLTKMGAHSRLEVATTAVRCGMVSPETGEWLIRVG